jgi:hypothetical protein
MLDKIYDKLRGIASKYTELERIYNTIDGILRKYGYADFSKIRCSDRLRIECRPALDKFLEPRCFIRYRYGSGKMLIIEVLPNGITYYLVRRAFMMEKHEVISELPKNVAKGFEKQLSKCVDKIESKANEVETGLTLLKSILTLYEMLNK